LVTSGTGERRDGAHGGRRTTRFHGRVEHADARPCDEDGCCQAGEFRAPRRGAGIEDEPAGRWRWLCLDHVRAFNSGYNFFDQMSPDEVNAATAPTYGWERSTRPFATNAGVRFEDLGVVDPHDVLGGRFGRGFAESGAAKRRGFTGPERQALRTLALAEDATLNDIRKRYVELVRRYHPDHNGGDRGQERKLQSVIDAYTQLKASAVFSRSPQEVP
jgi:hypothetical protein